MAEAVKVLALMGIDDSGDSWNTVSLHMTRSGAETARKVHADSAWEDDGLMTLETFMNNNYEIVEHELQM